jgi:hypothetical protein
MMGSEVLKRKELLSLTGMQGFWMGEGEMERKKDGEMEGGAHWRSFKAKRYTCFRR